MKFFKSKLLTLIFTLFSSCLSYAQTVQPAVTSNVIYEGAEAGIELKVYNPNQFPIVCNLRFSVLVSDNFDNILGSKEFLMKNYYLSKGNRNSFKYLNKHFFVNRETAFSIKHFSGFDDRPTVGKCTPIPNNEKRKDNKLNYQFLQTTFNSAINNRHFEYAHWLKSTLADVPGWIKVANLYDRQWLVSPTKQETSRYLKGVMFTGDYIFEQADINFKLNKNGQCGFSYLGKDPSKPSSSICGSDYVHKVSSKCKPRLFKQASSKHCGIQAYKQKRSRACGVQSYKRKRSSYCSCQIQGPRIGGSGCIRRHRCRVPQHGVQQYKSCRHKSHGAQTFKSCRNKAHGVQTYTACEHISHGKLNHKSCGNQERFRRFKQCANSQLDSYNKSSELDGTPIEGCDLISMNKILDECYQLNKFHKK